jgi:hypothetical protein
LGGKSLLTAASIIGIFIKPVIADFSRPFAGATWRSPSSGQHGCE